MFYTINLPTVDNHGNSLDTENTATLTKLINRFGGATARHLPVETYPVKIAEVDGYYIMQDPTLRNGEILAKDKYLSVRIDRIESNFIKALVYRFTDSRFIRQLAHEVRVSHRQESVYYCDGNRARLIF